MPSQHRELERAVGYVRSLIISLARRRPAHFSNSDADGVLSELRIARIPLERALAKWDARQGELKPERPTDTVDEASA
jgi:hypothetical protein